MPSGPYQSRLLNLIAHQTRRLRDRSLQTLRYVQLGAVWGAQILLYPIYALFQSSRLVGRQMGQAARRTRFRLQAVTRSIATVFRPTSPPASLTADTPIRQVLQVVQQLALPVQVDVPGAIAPVPWFQQFPLLKRLSAAIARWFPAAPSTTEIVTFSENSLTENATSDRIDNLPQVRGIATLLESRRLVLVTIHNQLLDILTAEQQVFLQRRLIGAVANYLRSHQPLYIAPPQRPILLPPPADRETLLPPIRAFRRLMAWMQESPVAIATNLFHESSLLLPASQAPHSSPAPVYTAPSLETILGRMMGGAAIGVRLPQESPLPDYWIDLHVSEAAGQPSPSGSSLPSSPQPLLPGDVRMTAVQAMLTLKAGLAGLLRPLTSNPLSHIPMVNPVEDDDRLDWDSPLPSGTNQELTASLPVWSPGTEVVSADCLEQAMSERSPASQDPLSVLPPTGLSVTREQSSNLSAPSLEDELTIDTQVKLVEYVKHPLEQLLEWIDRIMLWLENRTLGFWHWLGSKIK